MLFGNAAVAWIIKDILNERCMALIDNGMAETEAVTRVRQEFVRAIKDSMREQARLMYIEESRKGR